jgi:2-amino-4-hydroxy-6-hydroxymethyldihydropteridine diphosphokinase
MQQRAAIALGANLGDRHATLEEAIRRIGQEIGRIAARSRWHETPALMRPDDPAKEHPAYLNGVVVALTELTPPSILARLQLIERSLGRNRAAEQGRWQPRPIDLDLIAVEAEVLDLPDLRLPHPEMQNRAFVLVPMAEVWPDWRHPRLGRTVEEMLAGLPDG